MVLASFYRVYDAFAFLDAFAEAAASSKDWELDRIKFDYGWQFVYVKYTGREFRGQGLMASAFAPLGDPTTLRVTIRADQWPTHVMWDDQYRPERLVRPLLAAARKASQPKLRIANESNSRHHRANRGSRV